MDPNISRKIAGLTKAGKKDFILEIGPGRGALTQLLKKTGARIAAVEIDPLLVRELELDFGSSVNIIEKDILEFDLHSCPDNYIVIGNLPYNITSPVIFRLLETPGWCRIILMIQKEVAERICAESNSKLYGRMTVMAQTFSKVKIQFYVPPSVFLPQPDVHSAVITIEPAEPPDVDYARFAELVKQSFLQRRKTLRNALSGTMNAPAREKYGSRRAESLSPPDFVDLYNLVFKQ